MHSFHRCLMLPSSAPTCNYWPTLFNDVITLQQKALAYTYTKHHTKTTSTLDTMRCLWLSQQVVPYVDNVFSGWSHYRVFTSGVCHQIQNIWGSWHPPSILYNRWVKDNVNTINLLATDFFFQILAHPVFKMWVIQKPNKVALWNKRHFEGKKMDIIQHV